MRKKVMKPCVKSLVVELLLATALVVTSTPISVQADNEASQAPPSSGMARQTDREAAGQQEVAADVDEPASEPVLHQFVATAYCLRGRTSSGIQVNPGSVAADPEILPIGSVIRLHAGEYSGIYTVLDTGAKVRGRRLDIWFPSYQEAIEFGVRTVKVEIIRYGWEPTETEASSL